MQLAQQPIVALMLGEKRRHALRHFAVAKIHGVGDGLRQDHFFRQTGDGFDDDRVAEPQALEI